MDIKPIKSEADYKRARRDIEELWEAKPDTTAWNSPPSSSKRSSESTIPSYRPIRSRPSSTA